MIRHGKPPFLECSSKGDRRFSAFYARLQSKQPIEEVYQAYKKFDGPNGITTGLSIKEAKGRLATNLVEAKQLYYKLWNRYINENKDLIPVLVAAPGLSDIFGQPYHVCQATELWRIRSILIYKGYG